MDALTVIAARRSIRKFKNEPVSRDVVLKLIDAARMAPTARNVQPWEFVIVMDAHKRRELAAATDHGKFIAEAPVCIVVLSHETRYYLEDGSAATTNILLAAAALGLGGCWIAGDKKPYAPQIVSICGAPGDMKLVSLVAVGHPLEVPVPPKRSLDDVVHWESF